MARRRRYANRPHKQPVIPKAGIQTPSSVPWGITAGPDGNLWFTEAGGGKIGRITP